MDPTQNEYETYITSSCGDDVFDTVIKFGMKTTCCTPRYGKWGLAHYADGAKILYLTELVHKAPWEQLEEGTILEPCVVLT